jgi:hypothetical protein
MPTELSKLLPQSNNNNLLSRYTETNNIRDRITVDFVRDRITRNIASMYLYLGYNVLKFKWIKTGTLLRGKSDRINRLKYKLNIFKNIFVFVRIHQSKVIPGGTCILNLTELRQCIEASDYGEKKNYM